MKDAQAKSSRTAKQAAARVSVRVDFGDDSRLGPGKIALLEKIVETGSISAAGRSMGMSYRRAWLLVDALNRLLDQPVVTTSAGGAHGGGAEVTETGRRLIEAYRGLENRAVADAHATFSAFRFRAD